MTTAVNIISTPLNAVDAFFEAPLGYLRGRVVVYLRWTGNNIFGIVWGGALGGWVVYNTYAFVTGFRRWYRAEESTQPEELKTLALNGLSLGEGITGLITFIIQEGWIPLGRAAPYLQGAGYIFGLVSCSIGLVDDFFEFALQMDSFKHATRPEERVRAKHSMRIALLNLASRIFFIFWAVLGIGCLLAGVACPALYIPLVLSLVLSLLAMMYKFWLSLDENRQMQVNPA